MPAPSESLALMEGPLRNTERWERSIGMPRHTYWMKHPTRPGWFRIPFRVYRNLMNGGLMNHEKIAHTKAMFKMS